MNKKYEKEKKTLHYHSKCKQLVAFRKLLRDGMGAGVRLMLALFLSGGASARFRRACSFFIIFHKRWVAFFDVYAYDMRKKCKNRQYAIDIADTYMLK